MLVLLVDVHAATEDEHGIEPVERGWRLLGGNPLDRLGARGRRVSEDARSGVALVDDGQDTHSPRVSQTSARREMRPRDGADPTGAAIEVRVTDAWRTGSEG
jgi:hypothetical protein